MIAGSSRTAARTRAAAKLGREIDDDEEGRRRNNGGGGGGVGRPGSGGVVVGGEGGRELRGRGREPAGLRRVRDGQGGGPGRRVLRRREADQGHAVRHGGAAAGVRVRQAGGGGVPAAQRRRHPRPPQAVRRAAAVPAHPQLRLHHNSMNYHMNAEESS